SGLVWVGDSCTSRVGRWVVFAITAVIVVLGVQQALNIPIGETEAGSPLLWQDSPFNFSARKVNAKFAGSSQLVIYLHGSHENALKDPMLLDTLDNLRRYMLEQPEAGGTRDLTSLVRGVNRLFNYNDPKWAIVPATPTGISNLVFMYEA